MYGHCRVSTYDKENKELGRWVATQRSELKHLVRSMNASDDDKYKIQQLNGIGFEWSIQRTPKKTEQSVSNGLRLPTHLPASNGLRLPTK